MTDRASTWTAAPPTRDGFYWAHPRDASEPEVVEILGCPQAPYVLRAGKDFEEEPTDFTWWSERLPEPEAAPEAPSRSS